MIDLRISDHPDFFCYQETNFKFNQDAIFSGNDSLIGVTIHSDTLIARPLRSVLVLLPLRLPDDDPSSSAASTRTTCSETHNGAPSVIKARMKCIARVVRHKHRSLLSSHTCVCAYFESINFSKGLNFFSIFNECRPSKPEKITDRNTNHFFTNCHFTRIHGFLN